MTDTDALRALAERYSTDTRAPGTLARGLIEAQAELDAARTRIADYACVVDMAEGCPCPNCPAKDARIAELERQRCELADMLQGMIDTRYRLPDDPDIAAIAQRLAEFRRTALCGDGEAKL
jgi:hypothetical protein